MFTPQRTARIAVFVAISVILTLGLFNRSHVIAAGANLRDAVLPQALNWAPWIAKFAAAPAAPATQATKPKLYPNFDARTGGPKIQAVINANATTLRERAGNQVAGMAQGLTQLRTTVPDAEITPSALTGGVEIVRSKAGLTPPSSGSAETIVRNFLANNRTLYGLTDSDLTKLNYLGESVSKASGIRMVRVVQTLNDLPIFQSETRFVLDRNGRVIRSTGAIIPQPTAAALNVNNLVTPQTALARALESIGLQANALAMTTANANTAKTKLEIVANHATVSGNVPAQLVYFPAAPSILIPAWSIVVFTNGVEGLGDYYMLLDATNGGALLWRKNIRNTVSTHDARFRVYVQADGKTPADSPAPQSPSAAAPGAGTQFAEIAPSIVSMLFAQNITASPNGWINDCPGGVCGANETQTIGNNVHAYMDRATPNDDPDTDAASVLDGNGKPTGNPDANMRNRDFLGTAPRDFETGFLPAPQGGNPEAGQTATGAGSSGTNAFDQFRRAAVTQLFYTSNWYHDQLYQLGFDEAAGNFQLTNFSGMGLGNDLVLAECQDASGTNNANFATPPDGASGRMQMFRFTGPTVDRDGSLDNEIVIHELTHGLSNRLIGNAAGLVWDVGGGLGEGWSDFYALSLLNNTNADDPNASYATGAYATYKLIAGYLDNYVYGIRRFPYSTNNSVNPLTWADIDDTSNNLSGGIATSPINFNGGGAHEVHNIGEVWALSLWEVRARIIAANGNDVPTGNQKMLQIVTDAMKLTPANPTYIQARDALIDADCAANACANEQSIWEGFADRGLGAKASAPLAYMFGFKAGHMGITESFETPNLAVQTVTIDDSNGNNNGAIDPGEPIKLTVQLNNPWRSASKGVASATGTLTALTAGVTVVDGSSTYPAIAAQGNAAGDTFLFTVPTSATCGQSLKFTLQTTSTLGNGTNNIALRVGQATGTGAPVTYTRSSLGLAIPDNAPRGVIDTLNVTDDLEIADIDFRVDSLTHTFTGDLSVMLKAPNGYGTDFISLIGALIDDGPGDNLTNMVIDDDVAAAAANDMVQAAAAAAPFTKSWLPVFNAPWTTTAGFGSPDPVGELSRLDGTSTQGDWKVLVSDQFQIDTGTLQGWSIIVTPKAFTCTPFVPAVAVTGTKTVTGSFLTGSPVTYTVVLTNNGTATQADNAGNEFTDVLPAGVTLVSATATSGTAIATIGTNTVTWNGSLALLGGSTTITINATVNAAGGAVVSNQGTISFDANADATNEATALTDDPGVGGANDPTNFTVVGGTTATAIVSDLPDPTVIGQNYTVTFSVSVLTGTGTPTGNVTVSDGTNNCVATVAAGSCSLPSTSVGAKTLTATYAGDANFTGSVSATAPHTVNQASTLTTLVSDTPDPTVIGQNYTVTFTVTAVAPGVGTPAGNVTVSDGTNTCTATVAAGSCSLPSTSVGAKTLTATYAGDANFAGSVSATTAHTVNKGNTTTTVSSSLNPSTSGSSVTFTATVSPVAPANGTPTGTIQFKDNGTPLGAPVPVAFTGPATGETADASFLLLANGVATLTTSALAPGNHLITADYGGDASFNGSAAASGSGAVAQSVLSLIDPVVSDQKAGSVLVYNYYTSTIDPTRQNTRMNITNTHATAAAFVHLFFVDGSNCSVADSYICLTANQTASFLASDLDPGTSGYIVAVATDSAGCPIEFNYLIGDEYVKVATGHQANLGAEAIAAMGSSSVACTTSTSNVELRFDGSSYNFLPRTVALSNFSSLADGNNTLLIVNRIGGNLATGAAAIGSLFGLVYDDAEKAYSFSLSGTGCQLRGSLGGTFPRTTPRIESIVSSGRSGWIRLSSASDGAILGAVINANSNSPFSAGAFNQGRNLHKLTLTGAASYTIPVFPPTC